MGAQGLHVGDEVAGGVGRQIGTVGDVGPGPSAVALVEQHDAVARGIEEASLVRRGPAAGTTVDEDRRFAVGISRGLPVDLLAVADVEVAGGVGLDRRIEIAHGPKPRAHARRVVEERQ